MADDEKPPGGTPEGNGTATPENGTETPQGVYWRNKEELQDAIVFARKSKDVMTRLEGHLAKLESGDKKPAAKAGGDELSQQFAALNERVEMSEKRSTWHQALSDASLAPHERKYMTDLFEAVKPGDPARFLAEKVQEYGFGKTAGTAAPMSSGTQAQGKGSPAPGRDPNGLPANPRVLAKENPAAWAALSSEQRRTRVEEFKRSEHGPPLFPRRVPSGGPR